MPTAAHLGPSRGPFSLAASSPDKGFSIHLDTIVPARQCHRVVTCPLPRQGPSMIKRVTLLLLCLVTGLESAQERDVVVTGGWLFASTSNARVRNPGILIRAGKILRVGGDLSMAAADAERVQVADTETVVPGFFDLHAHYEMD